MADVPRPGVWADQAGADLRSLTQDETDVLIRSEIWHWCAPLGISVREFTEVVGIVGNPTGVLVDPVKCSDGTTLAQRAWRQRGGIDSDPLVRLLAFRIWGERDRQWFELRGVKAGDSVGLPPYSAITTEGVWVSLAWPSDQVIGCATHDARPGEVVALANPLRWNANHLRCRVSDRRRARPDLELDANGDLVSTAGTGSYALGNVRELAERSPTVPWETLAERDDRCDAVARAIRQIAAASGRSVAEVSAEMHEVLSRLRDMPPLDEGQLREDFHLPRDANGAIHNAMARRAASRGLAGR